MALGFSSPFSAKTTFYFNSSTRMIGSASGRHHYHNLFEVYYMECGECNYFINNKVYEIKSGDLVLIPEGVVHRTTYKSGTEYTRKLINCSRHFIPKSVANILPKLTYLYRNKEISGEIADIMGKIEAEHKHGDSFSHDALKSYVNLLFLLIARNENTAGTASRGSMLVEGTAAYIQENLSGEITLSKIAESHSVTPEHLSRQFKRETGFGFNEYVTLLRLQRAEYLLTESPSISISDAAYACGFNDSNYFSTKFKAEYGISPLKFKKMKLEKDE